MDVRLEDGAKGRGMALGTARAFAAGTAGVTTIEFALVSVPFLGLLFAIFQVSLAFLMQQGLKVAIEGAARQVMIGAAQGQASVSSWQGFRDTLVCPATGSLLPSFVTCPKILVDVRSYSSFSTLTTSQVSRDFLSDGSGPRYLPGGPCDIVVVRAVYPIAVYLPFLTDATLGPSVSASTTGTTSYGGSMVQLLTAASVFRNEPYAASARTNAAGGCAP